MQPQDNNLPQDQSMSAGQGSNDPGSNQSSVMGGATFQPQTNPQSNTPTWQNDAAADAQQLYNQPPQEGAVSAPAMPPNPLMQEAQAQPSVLAAPEVLNKDFQQAANLAAPAPTGPAQQTPASPSPMPPNPLMTENQTSTPAPDGVAPEGIATQPEPIVPQPPQQTPMNPSEPAPVPPAAEAAPLLPPDMSQVPAAPAQLYAQQPGLPGADQLGAAAAGMDQSALSQSVDMGTYGPPPKNNKKIIFIIIGAILGIALITGIVLFVTSSTKNKQTAQNVTTNTPQQQTQNTTPAPTAGPATPPEGYVTIDKQCYTFALFNPNTVPTDQACSFENATFGKQKTSTISVITTTETLKAIDDYFTLVKQNVTVVSEEATKLDNLDAKQLIYKASDGKTYSEVAALIVGKNYQQDGKAVTAISIKTSYQISFDQEVTKNVIDTWRWK